MPVTQKKSLSDMHDLDDLGHPRDLDQTLQCNCVDIDIYKMMVLRFASDCTEEDVDQQFLQMAIDLGINIPANPKDTSDLVTCNVSANALESVSDDEPSPSQSSQSPHLTSDSSSEYKNPSNTSSITTVSSSPASIISISSTRSSYTKFKRSFRALRRRKTVGDPIPTIPFPTSAIKAWRPPSPHRPPTTDHFSVRPVRCRSISSINRKSSKSEPCSQSPSVKDLEEAEDLITARQRSLDNAQLNKLRAYQLDEQGRFITFEANQYHLLRLQQIQSQKARLERYTQQSQILRRQQSDALTSLEHRHLQAEVDLNQTFQMERQGCETRLRHMQAYCNPHSNIVGMPDRSITMQDRHLLEQQYHIRNGMDNLHAARINVLREKQTRQLERVTAKQKFELDAISDELSKEIQDLYATFEIEELQLRKEFSERKQRLIARWALTEAIERRKLENLMGKMFAPLPPVSWTNRRSIVETGSEVEPYKGFAHETMMAYDTTAMRIIGIDL